MIEILSAGPLCSVQDMGRRGYRKIGVSVSGAMDTLAMQTANVMVGNARTAAGIEVTMFPLRARFHTHTRIAITGGGSQASVGERSVPRWWCVDVDAGEVLTLKPSGIGARTCIAIAGGIEVPEALGSRSTDIKVGFGGYEGRCLAKGDTLTIGASAHERPGRARGFGVRPPDFDLAWHDDTATSPHGHDGAARVVTHVRVVRGPDYDAFREASLAGFWASPWKVTPDSNRIGYRLQGPQINLREPVELLSHGIVPGVIQVPPSGQPIVMMSDAQTSGGYPIVGTVIEADMWRLAQAPIGSAVRFHDIDVAQAVSASRTLENWIGTIARSRWSVL